MMSVPNRIFFTGGYMAVFLIFLLVRWCTNGQHMPALVSVHLIGARDRHLSKLQ